MKLAGVIDYGALQGVATPNLAAGTSIGSLVGMVMNLVIPIAGMIMLFYLIWSGIQYMMSQGDPKALATARQNITYSIVGFAVVVFAYMAAAIVGVSLELPLIQQLFPQ